MVRKRTFWAFCGIKFHLLADFFFFLKMYLTAVLCIYHWQKCWKVWKCVCTLVCWVICSLLPTSNAVAGESALDRIACGLGGKIILPMIKQHIMQMLQNRKYYWRYLNCPADLVWNSLKVHIRDVRIWMPFFSLKATWLCEVFNWWTWDQPSVFVASWLEVPPCRADGAVGHWRGLPPADGGHPPRDRQLCPSLLLRSCKRHSFRL